jgi:hypothetical protein
MRGLLPGHPQLARGSLSILAAICPKAAVEVFIPEFILAAWCQILVTCSTTGDR